VYALLFADAGLSIAQITSLFMIWCVVPVLLELPSGALADLVPRRMLLVAAALVRGAGFAGWVLAPGYPVFALGFVLWGAGSALESGTFESYVYDRLSGEGRERAYRSVIARGRAGGLGLNLAATVLATPLLAAGGYPAVGAVSVAACLAQSVLAATLPADARRREPMGDAESAEPTLRGMLRAGFAEVRRAVPVRRTLLLAALLPIFGVLDEYWALLADAMHASTTSVPILVAGTVAAQALGALAGNRCPGRAAGPALLAAAVLIAAGALTAAPAGFALVAVGYGLLEMAVVVIQVRLQGTITGSARATVTSLAGLLEDLLNIALLGMIALGSAALSVIGIVVAVCALMVPVAGIAVRWIR
jgi:MFS family permease